MQQAKIPTVVIDDTPIKRRGICEFIAETSLLQLAGQAGNSREAGALLVDIREREGIPADLTGWLVLSDLRLAEENGIALGRMLLESAPGLRIVIYTQDPSWTLAAEVFRQEYARGKRSVKKAMGLHGYALFQNLVPDYLELIASTVILQRDTFLDPEVLTHLLKRLRGLRLTPRQEECAILIAQGASNDEIALSMGFLTARGEPNSGPVENLVSDLYTFFAIEGAPGDPGRRVLLAHAYEAYAGQRER